MRAIDLYNQLERDFITRDMTHKWAKYMGEIEEHLSSNFKERSWDWYVTLQMKLTRFILLYFLLKKYYRKSLMIEQRMPCYSCIILPFGISEEESHSIKWIKNY